MKFVAFFLLIMYNDSTELDGEIAVPCNLQPATAGSKNYLGIIRSNMSICLNAMKSRSYAINSSEPCQVLTEASLRRSVDVP